jgi:hypothetical protein
MATQRRQRRGLSGYWRIGAAASIAVAVASMATGTSNADEGHHSGFRGFRPGDLVVSRSVYVGSAGLIDPGVTELPPGCTTGCTPAVADGSYPEVWNNDAADGSFGITSPIFLDQITPSGRLIDTLAVPTDEAVTSFSSKSELALNLSTTGRHLTFMGYVTAPNTLDVSNANTPGVIDPTNPVPGAYYRVVVEVNRNGRFHFTETNAYSGNNGRAAILNDSRGQHIIYMAGNAGNGANPQPDGVITGAGAQIADAQREPEVDQTPGAPTPFGSFNITQLGDKPDKIGKDTNFRGLTIFDNVVYLTKGSGGNGVNTVYFVDTTGTACPNGVGLPVPGAPLPTSPIAFDPSLLQTEGVTPYNMCILKGFPTALKSATSFPFGVWFANADTMYVADEGNGDNTFSTASGTYVNAAAQTTAGLQKWVFNGTSWNLAYTLTAGLNLGVPYTVPGYPTGDNPATGLPWAPATDGLRNLTGRVNRNGSVTIWAITSTVSGNGDQGADPNELVSITDNPAATAPAPGESFSVIRSAGFGEVLRGVSFTPGT